ncbi:MAG: UDP-N-acetylglucosamine 1-carboxyvinyltransferase [Clostridia bacterium]|nr:UDP-N-acetylglucosamine 1-carboxyvinyltransferase [Clostridia bacterium]
MSKYVINGGKKLFGKLYVPSSKNAVLPILAGSIMCDEKVVIKKIPYFSDVLIMLKILEEVGCKVNKFEDNIEIDTQNLHNFQLSENLTKDIRSSIFMLGPLLTKFKKAKVAYPGGCNIGLRPIDLHIKGLKALNVKIAEEYGFISCDGSNMKPATINLDFPSVGATENLIMASVKLKGKTTIINCAKEPEIIDLQNFLNSMGAKIVGAGSDTIEIEGVDRLHFSCYTPIPDRIIAGTYLIGVAMTGGNLLLENVKSQDLTILIDKLKGISCKIKCEYDKIYLESSGKLKSFGEISTSPYPGFPTDLQPQMMALATCLKGVSIIEENLFESRFKHIPELKKMGAKIILKDKCAIISGKNKLFGANVYATDLRAGSALVLAGLKAEGVTIVNDIHHIERGYLDLDKELKNLGADILRLDEN